ncbi:hypothetical protein F2Q69_00052606 [Brassica cretica]|uniref:Uncharacterized protein n=1 Tax=Brassica cretica TaxID=69181 RepID=A0A8S9N445_BRACR|nr:hypothetical protein F2Q69_00052606 [Brassica cretica]
MDSSDSSLDLTAEVEDPKAIVARNVSPVTEGNLYPPIGPPSVIGVEEVADWRMKDRVPSLVAKISETLEIFPGQLSHPAWRTLIALQNLGDLQGLLIGVAEVLCSYFVSPLSGAEWRYYLHPRGKEPPVREVPKRERKCLPAFAGNWTEKFAFMRLPGFLPIWQLEDLPRVDYSSGRKTVEQMLRLPIERRQTPFLVSKAALKRCSIWGEMSRSKGDEALAEYKKALEVMSVRKSAPKRAASVDDDEVQFLRSSKRLTVAATAPSCSKKKFKALGSSPSASYDWTTVLTNLNTKVFPSTLVLLASEEDSSVAIQLLQGDLFQVASQLFHLGERMVGAASTKAEMDSLASQLCKEKDAEENDGEPVDDLALMKMAYTNKKTGQIDDGLVREVVTLVQTQVKDEVSQLQTEDDDSTASTNLSRFRINEIVESSVPKKKGRLVGLDRRTRSIPPSSAPRPFVDPEVLTAQLKDKDDRISLLETQMAAQQAGYKQQRRLNQQMMEMMQRMYPHEVFPNVPDP